MIDPFLHFRPSISSFELCFFLLPGIFLCHWQWRDGWMDEMVLILLYHSPLSPLHFCTVHNCLLAFFLLSFQPNIISHHEPHHSRARSNASLATQWSSAFALSTETIPTKVPVFKNTCRPQTIKLHPTSLQKNQPHLNIFLQPNPTKSDLIQLAGLS